MRSTRVLHDAMVNSHCEIVGQRQVEKGIDAVLALLAGDLGDRLALDRLECGIVHLVDVMRSQLPKPVGFFSSSRNALRNAGSA